MNSGKAVFPKGGQVRLKLEGGGSAGLNRSVHEHFGCALAGD